MLAIDIFVPLADNSGNTFDEAAFAAFEEDLAEQFGGCSRLPGTVRGAWKDGGRLYRDDLAVYRVALSSIIQAGRLEGVIERAKLLFRQEALFIQYGGQAETL